MMSKGHRWSHRDGVIFWQLLQRKRALTFAPIRQFQPEELKASSRPDFPPSRAQSERPTTDRASNLK